MALISSICYPWLDRSRVIAHFPRNLMHHVHFQYSPMPALVSCGNMRLLRVMRLGNQRPSWGNLWFFSFMKIASGCNELWRLWNIFLSEWKESEGKKKGGEGNAWKKARKIGEVFWRWFIGGEWREVDTLKDNMEYLQHDYMLMWTASEPLILCLSCNKWSCGAYQNSWKEWNALIWQIYVTKNQHAVKVQTQKGICGTVLTF